MSSLLYITGPTWAFRQDFKQMGGRWNPRLGAWLIPAVRREQLLELATMAPFEISVYDGASGQLVPLRRPYVIGE